MATRSPIVSDETLIKTVQQQCEIRGWPVVPTSTVSDAEPITIEQQQVHNRLEELAEEGKIRKIEVGSNWKVWWVPKDQEKDVGFSNAINWDNVNGADIPKATIEEHPDYHTPTFWEEWESKATTVLDFAVLALVVGVPIYVLNELNVSYVRENLQLVGGVSLLGGLFFAVVGAAVSGGAKLGRLLQRYGAGKAVEVTKDRLRDFIARRTNYRIVRVNEDEGEE